MDEEKKNGNIDKNFDAIDSALKELDGVYKTSLKLFDSVLMDSNTLLAKEAEENNREPSSKLSGRQEDILDRIIDITNGYINFNKRCDL